MKLHVIKATMLQPSRCTLFCQYLVSQQSHNTQEKYLLTFIGDVFLCVYQSTRPLLLQYVNKKAQIQKSQT